MCDKVIYTSRNTAAAAIKGLHKDKNTRHSKRFPSTCYYCSDCQGWHLCSPQKSKKRRQLIAQPEVNMDANMRRVYKKNTENLRIKDFTHARFQTGTRA